MQPKRRIAAERGAQLHKHATAYGDPRAAASLVDHMHALHPTDHRPADWAAAHAMSDNPYAVATLLDSLRAADAHDQLIALADYVVAHAAPDDTHAVAMLLDNLRVADTRDQFIALADRAASGIPLNARGEVAVLLQRLREADAYDQFTALADRAALHVPLDDPRSVGWVLFGLWSSGRAARSTRCSTAAPPPAPHSTTRMP